MSSNEKRTYYIYLAGPEVFLPDPIQAGKDKKKVLEIISKDCPFNLIGLYPMDNEIPDFAPNKETGLRIYQANMEQIKKADAVIVNMVRFRGPSMDVGSAFEMGVARGLNKPVFGYYDTKPFYNTTEQPQLYCDKVKKFCTDDGLTVESFDMEDNLMMIGALNDAQCDIETSFDNAVYNAIAWIIRSNYITTQ